MILWWNFSRSINGKYFFFETSAAQNGESSGKQHNSHEAIQAQEAPEFALLLYVRINILWLKCLLA